MINKIILGDCLDVLVEIPDNFVDLIYIDPPFYSQEDYGDFNDKWNVIEDYLNFMILKLKEMYRILKITGSFYLQCDYHASHYLKIELDKIFGYDNFRSEIIWNANSISGFKSQRKGWIRNHDTILYYVKSNNFTFNKIYLPYSKKYYHKYRNKDENGRLYALSNGRRIYLDERKGLPISDVWDDIISYQTRTRSKEYIGYPTQKPNKLLERIIRASSNKNDIIIDCFCGSGTTLVIAKKLNRKYIGIDINEKAVNLSKKRLNKVIPVNSNSFI
jgi:site-specific DNA-methyltransferase (adenine-specific)